MKAYTREEKEEAKKKLPKPTLGFLGAPALTELYMGMYRKHALNLRQFMVITEITNTILMGLEAESTLETNLHQFLPELTNDQTRELVSDINDRVFKEAKRRLAENILEPEPVAVERSETDAELEALEEEWGKKGIIPEFEKKNEEERAQEPALLEAEEKRAATAASVASGIVVQTGSSIQQAARSIQNLMPIALPPTPQKSPEPTPSIAANKLTAPTSSAPAQFTTPKPLASAVPATTPTQTTPQSEAVAPQNPTPKAAKPAAPITYESGVDPYRERPE